MKLNHSEKPSSQRRAEKALAPISIANELKQLRLNIHRIDARLLSLIKERMSLSSKIGTLKKKSHMPIEDTKREEEVLHKNISLAQTLGLKETLIRKITSELIHSCKEHQKEAEDDKS